MICDTLDQYQARVGVPTSYKCELSSRATNISGVEAYDEVKAIPEGKRNYD